MTSSTFVVFFYPNHAKKLRVKHVGCWCLFYPPSVEPASSTGTSNTLRFKWQPLGYLPYTDAPHGSELPTYRSGKKYATAYAAKDVHVGIAVTRPPCNEDF